MQHGQLDIHVCVRRSQKGTKNKRLDLKKSHFLDHQSTSKEVRLPNQQWPWPSFLESNILEFTVFAIIPSAELRSMNFWHAVPVAIDVKPSNASRIGDILDYRFQG